MLALALRARVRAHDHTIAIITRYAHAACTVLCHVLSGLAVSLALSLSLNMKRGAPSLEGEASSSKQRRTVSYSTFQKWKTELDKDCQTVTWLECDKTATGTVTALKCGICIRFQSAIERRRNYSDRWVRVSAHQ